MIREQKSNRELKGDNHSLHTKKSDAENKILKIQRTLNNAAWSKETRTLMDGEKGDHSVHI